MDFFYDAGRFRGRITLLLFFMLISKLFQIYFPQFWIIIPLFISIFLTGYRFSNENRIAVRLLQLIAVTSGFYSLIHYPLMAVRGDSHVAHYLYYLVLLAWLLSLAASVICLKIPSLGVLPAATLLWINSMAGSITGLPATEITDIVPLAEVSMTIGFGLLTIRLIDRKSWEKTPDPSRVSASDSFGYLVLLMAIAVHLANYFWSFAAKLRFKPIGVWLYENNPAYMYLVALDDNHILYSKYDSVVSFAYHFFDTTYPVANLWVLLTQAAAITAFFIPKRAFFLLLVLFDVMHISIIVIAGVNFWPWIILNLAITAVVARPDFVSPSRGVRALASFFIVICPLFAQIQRLGWLDSGANNKIFFQAVDESGRRYDVPTNFFTYYSYSLGHMDYGAPDPTTAFPTGEPNGAATDYATFKAGRACDAAALTRRGGFAGFQAEQMARFVRDYHQLALAIDDQFGNFPYDIYPHHFYIPMWQSAEFRHLDKHRIVAYIYRRESVCVSFESEQLERRVISASEYRINLEGGDDNGTN